MLHKRYKISFSSFHHYQHAKNFPVRYLDILLSNFGITHLGVFLKKNSFKFKWDYLQFLGSTFMTTIFECNNLRFSLYNGLWSEVKWKLLSYVWLFATPGTVACQAPLSMGFSRQDYWSGLPFSSPGDLPNPGIELRSPALQTDSLPSESLGKSQWAVKKSLNTVPILVCYIRCTESLGKFSTFTVIEGLPWWSSG